MDIQHIKNYFITNKKHIIQLIIIGIIIHAIIIEIFINNEYNDKKSIKKKINTYISGCVYKVKNPKLQEISLKLKGEKYLFGELNGENIKYRKECLISRWNITHLIGHIIITFFYPKLWPLIFIGTFMYEIIEYKYFKCHDYSDILYNSVGIYIGYKLNQLYYKK